jgi:hypothetical protein
MLWFFGAVIVVSGGVTVLWRAFGSPIFTLMGRTNEFLDDWFGVPDRDGVPGRKGVMARLTDLEIEKIDRLEFRQLADQVAEKATHADLLQLRVALERHITRVEEIRGLSDGDVPHPSEPS